MKLKKAIELIQEFEKMDSAKINFHCTVSEIWHFNYSRGKGVPFGDESGIYIYSNPCDIKWDQDPKEIEEDVLYIGKSNGDLGGRVWSHVGLIYEPNTKIECDPRFKYHQWNEDKLVPTQLNKRISIGDISVVTVKVETTIENLLPEAIEKYLLTMCVRFDGKLPALNKGL